MRFGEETRIVLSIIAMFAGVFAFCGAVVGVGYGVYALTGVSGLGIAAGVVAEFGAFVAFAAVVDARSERS